MSLQRVEKIRSYAKPCQGHLQLLSSEGKSHSITPKYFHSETLIQKNNLNFARSGVFQSKSTYIDSLCKSFELSAAKGFSPFDNFNKKKSNDESTSKSMQQQQQQPCKKCAKIRNSVKKFFRVKFETENPDARTTTTQTSLAAQPNHIRINIIKDGSEHVGVIETQKTHHNATTSEPEPTVANTNSLICYGCDQPERESSSRGPPLVSPVCHDQVSASPLGEIFKNYPERIKKMIKIDRPRSLAPRKRVVDKEQPRETSVHERQKPIGR